MNETICIMCEHLATTKHDGDDVCQACKSIMLEEQEEFEEVELGDNACINFPWREM